MKFPLSWLKDYLDINLSPGQIAKVLTSLGIEVDSVQQVQPSFNSVIVVTVTSVEKHPNADKLVVATVSDGINSYQVVCGAPNCRAGLKTALAQVGATLGDKDGTSFKIKQTALRGVESSGMLCSEKELQISDRDEGIIEFASQIAVGADVAEMYADSIFEVSLTPNLGHCSNLIGIARELATATDQTCRCPSAAINENDDAISKYVSVTVADPARCPRYACRVIKNVKIAPSPSWMQQRLQACGIRPINNIVDITNYVLLETGQPLHAFDLKTLQGNALLIRTAQSDEQIVTLDGNTRTLNAEDLLICDQTPAGSRPIALAGVMGGGDTEISDATTDVLLESAFFQPAAIRRTSKRLGLHTDASRRFERHSDPNGVLYALERAAMLMADIAGGSLCQGTIDIASSNFPCAKITCRLSKTNQLLGTHLSVGEVEGIFKRLGYAYKWDGKDLFELEVPTYRNDLQIEVDIIEEIARIYGYDNIVKSRPKYRASDLIDSPIFLFETQVRARLLAEGLQELLTCDLIGPSLLNIVRESSMAPEAVVNILNPTSIEQSILRTSLLPGLLQVAKHNFDRENHDLAGFEIGKIHFKDKEQYKEQLIAAIVLMGKVLPHHWDYKPHNADFFDIKGIVENFLHSLQIAAQFKESTLKTLHSGRQMIICVDDLEIGALGEVHPAIVKRLDVPQKIFFAEINLHDLYRVRPALTQVQELAIFPSSMRDWTVTITEQLPVQKIIDHIYSIPSQLLEKVFLFDIYHSDKLSHDSRNATFRFIYRDREKTMAQSAVEAEHLRIVSEAIKIITA